MIFFFLIFCLVITSGSNCIEKNIFKSFKSFFKDNESLGTVKTNAQFNFRKLVKYMNISVYNIKASTLAGKQYL